MTTAGDYCTVQELKGRLWPTGTTPDNEEDTILSAIIAAASRTIDNYCNRRFYSTTADETRYFTTDDSEYLFPDIDIISVTTLQTDDDGDRTYENTWATTDYDLLPDNAALDSLPYTYLRLAPMGNYSLSKQPRGVKIVGKFGFCATGSHPRPVREACLLQCERLFLRKDAPFGVISNQAGGDMRLLEKLDPDIELLLAGYRRIV